MLSNLKNLIVSLIHDERAQDAFEYILIIGGVTVAIIIGIAAASPSLLGAVGDGVCGAINSLDFITVDCDSVAWS
jgi:hypothetical protein